MDSFSNARKEAIERTIVVNRADLPNFNEIVGLDEVGFSLKKGEFNFLRPESFGLRPAVQFSGNGNCYGNIRLNRNIRLNLFYIYNYSRYL